MATDTYVQVPPDSTGKKIRMLEVNILLADGTVGTTELQVISIADEKGNLIDLDNSGTLCEIRDILAEIKLFMELKGGM